ncbi:MAG: amidohydrolase family protein [Desulfovibrionales bacterium]|nr:amidohydrolase family protein [Desulfovibrionales bacterium]
MWDICFRRIRLIDPVQGLDEITDLAIRGETIAGVGEYIEGQARLEISGEGLILTHGLADLHTHVGGRGFCPLAVPADDAGIYRSVTLLGDAGTAGESNFTGLLEAVRLSRTRIRHFLNIHPKGIAELPQNWSEPQDFAAFAERVEQYRDRICGIKLLAVSSFVEHAGIAGLEKIKKLAMSLQLPLMVHIGTEPDGALPSCWEAFCDALPRMLDAGDILSHCYTGKPGGLITPDRRFYAPLRQAAARGVVFDTAVALTHFLFSVARQGLDDGFLPTCVSTDLTLRNCQRIVCDLPLVMSRFLALGLPLSEIVRCVTERPYKALGVECGILAPGWPATLSVLAVEEQPILFGEGKDSLAGALRLVPFGAVLNGRFFQATKGENVLI